VTVHDLDLVRYVGHPDKADPPPVVDADIGCLSTVWNVEKAWAI
jgi:hypothetical protein